jgi:hypothetical protein
VLQAEQGTREVARGERGRGLDLERAGEAMSHVGLRSMRDIRSNLMSRVEQLLGSQKETAWT